MAKLPRYRCYRCAHKWTPRSKGRPKVCSSYKSPYWDRPPLSPWKGRGITVEPADY